MNSKQSRHTRRTTKKKKSIAKRRPAKRNVIDLESKGTVLALEPPIDRNQDDLDPDFRAKLSDVLAALAEADHSFKFVEGYRTVERQQWLYGSGRPKEKYGRIGPILTYRDGLKKRSIHQGDGEPGTGKAADCYPMRDGKVYIPPASDSVWQMYADAVTAEGLVAGYNWEKLKDAPHCEMTNG